ncbi:response regulator receiver domain [Vibrio brasiliensis]|uniref:response regulator receiver domain n=1 Tax=Vibrio brasiliensis TaxID=170652 RepID=UPI001EFC58A3|nr:response regulator receiver domain [Vibrio brasiliensis]MCG9724457.1 response regulator receiver domain [Vibrio brasiliensis]
MANLDNLIKEVYINPIRSVLIVDDEFVSLDKMIDFSASLYEGDSPETVKSDLDIEYPNGLDMRRAQNMVSAFRDERRNWLCDIHDGKDIVSGDTEEKIANHLHQSDLLILDYNLTADHTDGTTALSLIKKISENTHFNLIVIYTKSSIVDTFHEVLYSLTKKEPSLDEEPDAMKQMSLQLWYAEDPSIEDRLNSLFASVNFAEAMNCFKRKLMISSLTFYSQLEEIFREKPEDVQLSIDELFYLGLYRSYVTIEDKLLGEEQLFNEAFIDGEVNWIKNNRLFVTVVDKNATEPQNLPDMLFQALCSWNPKPLRLLMSKIRTELDGHGISFEDAALSNDYVHAGWLREFVSATSEESRWVAKKSIQQVMLSLSESLQNNMMNFSSDLKEQLSQSAIQDLVRSYHKLDINDNDIKIKMSSYFNANACSKEISGNQLKTGHVINIGDYYYLCLTPACDLVPSQSNEWKSKLGDLMPVKLVLLHDESKVFNGSPHAHKKLLQDLNSNNYIVLDIQGELKGFSYVVSSKSNPQWEQAFVASKGGLDWSKENAATLTLIRIGLVGEEGEVGTNFDTGEVTLPYTNSKATVVGELRYEYAINLLQKFGMSQSRVGLDFAELKL